MAEGVEFRVQAMSAMDAVRSRTAGVSLIARPFKTNPCSHVAHANVEHHE